MEQIVSDNAEKSRFEIHDDGELAGFAEYHRFGEEIAFIHTEIDPGSKAAGWAADWRVPRWTRHASRGLPSCPTVLSSAAGSPSTPSTPT